MARIQPVRGGELLDRLGVLERRLVLPVELVGAAEVADRADPAGDDARAAALSFRRQTAYHGDVGTHPQDARLQPPTAAAVA